MLWHLARARALRLCACSAQVTTRRAGLLRVLTTLTIRRGGRKQRTPDQRPLEEGDYFLYNKLEESAADGNLAEERVVERLSQDDIVSALSEVPHDFRDVIVLVDIGDFSYQDAAQILGIPIGTVMSPMHPGRRILNRALPDTSRAAPAASGARAVGTTSSTTWGSPGCTRCQGMASAAASFMAARDGVDVPT